MPLLGVDASSRAANNLLDPERGIAIFVAYVANPAAIWRKACLGTIELTEAQRQRCGTLHSREPELLPLAAMIAAEQDSPAIRCDQRLRAPGRFFAEDFFKISGRVHCH